MSRSRSRSPRREESTNPTSDAASAAPSAPVPWWQKFKPAKSADDELGYGETPSANPWLKRPVTQIAPAWPEPEPVPAPPANFQPQIQTSVTTTSGTPSTTTQPTPTKSALLLENVPGELNNLSRLYDGFKDFGEILTVHPVPLQARAFVEYRDMAAVNTALHVLASGSSSNPATQAFLPCKASVSFSVPAGNARPPPPPRAPGGEGAGPGPSSGRAQNLVMESDAVRRARERREVEQKKLEDKKSVLNKITQEIQNILRKLNDKATPDKTKEGYRKLLDNVKVKKEKIAKEIEQEEMRVFEIQQRKYMEKLKQYEKQNRRYTAELQESLTLDLRPRFVRIEELPEELRNAAVLNEYIRAMGVKEAESVAWLEDHTAAVLKFKSHAAAEVLFKHELAFKAEWVPNDEGERCELELELELFEEEVDETGEGEGEAEAGEAGDAVETGEEGYAQ